MKQIQAQTQMMPPEQDQGDPLFGSLGAALGTFLPMAFGLPPIPLLGQMLGTLAGGQGGMQNPFAQMPGLAGGMYNIFGGGFNPFQNQFNPYGSGQGGGINGMFQPPTNPVQNQFNPYGGGYG